MYENLLAHIRKYVNLDDAEAALLQSRLQHQQVKKKQHLLKEGRVCTANYFVLNGCLRLYVINNKGAEQIIQFAIDNWWMSDYDSFDRHRPSGFHIQAVENSELAFLDKAAQTELLNKIPQLESYFRVLFQRAYTASLMRLQYMFCLTKEERYIHFSNNFPEFVQRVPQYMLASFLGFTPEFLSKIRAKAVAAKRQHSSRRR
jgi:CRP-like cAMP-binding protein